MVRGKQIDWYRMSWGEMTKALASMPDVSTLGSGCADLMAGAFCLISHDYPRLRATMNETVTALAKMRKALARHAPDRNLQNTLKNAEEAVERRRQGWRFIWIKQQDSTELPMLITRLDKHGTPQFLTPLDFRARLEKQKNAEFRMMLIQMPDLAAPRQHLEDLIVLLTSIGIAKQPIIQRGQREKKAIKAVTAVLDRFWTRDTRLTQEDSLRSSRHVKKQFIRAQKNAVWAVGRSPETIVAFLQKMLVLSRQQSHELYTFLPVQSLEPGPDT